jgi:hypothetical protein
MVLSAAKAVRVNRRSSSEAFMVLYRLVGQVGNPPAEACTTVVQRRLQTGAQDAILPHKAEPPERRL